MFEILEVAFSSKEFLSSRHEQGSPCRMKIEISKEPDFPGISKHEILILQELASYFLTRIIPLGKDQGMCTILFTVMGF